MPSARGTLLIRPPPVPRPLGAPGVRPNHAGSSQYPDLCTGVTVQDQIHESDGGVAPISYSIYAKREHIS